MITIIVGVVCFISGGFAGFILMALMIAASRDDRRREQVNSSSIEQLNCKECNRLQDCLEHNRIYHQYSTDEYRLYALTLCPKSVIEELEGLKNGER